MKKKLFVNPVERTSVQGRDQRMYHTYDPILKQSKATARINRTKAKNSPETLVFERTDDGLRVRAGLAQIIENPFFEAVASDVQSLYNLPVSWNDRLDKIVSSPTITKQVELEILAGVDPGTYTEISSRKRIPGSVFIESGPEDIRTELEKFKYMLYERTNIITDETPRGRLAIQAIENSSLVAKNKDSINPNVHHWYISAEFEEQEQQLKAVRVNRKAWADLDAFLTQQSTVDQYRLAVLLKDGTDSSIIPNDANPTIVETALNNYVSTNNKHVVKNSKILSETIELFKTQKERFTLRYLVQEGLNRNVLSISNGYLFWHSKVSEPTAYKFNSIDAFMAFLYQHYERYNDKEKALQNFFGEYVEELRKFNITL